MKLPWAMGGASLGGADSYPDAFWDALHRLQGEGGYSTDPASVRDRELRATAVVAAVGAESIERAAQNALQNRTVELLRDWETELRLPNDAARTQEQRQARLVLVERTLAGAYLESVEASAELVADSSVYTTSRDDVDDAQAEDEALLTSLVALSEADWGNPLVRRDLAAVLERLLPARGRFGADALPAVHVEDLGRQLVTSLGARWADTSRTLGRTALASSPGTFGGGTLRSVPSRVRAYGPNTPLLAEDLQEIQKRTLIDAVSEQTGTYAQGGGGRVVLIEHLATLSAITTIDQSIEWRDRFVAMVLRVTATDVRPGQAGDVSHNVAASFQGFMVTGSGSSTWQMELETNVNVYADGTTGYLVVDNALGTDRYLSGFAIVTPPLGAFGV